MNWYLEAWKKYAIFEGRATRKEYWIFYLGNSIISFMLGLFAISLLVASKATLDVTRIQFVFQLIIILPSIAVGVRRMHDGGHSGWWLLAPIANIVFLISGSQPLENRYGPNPKSDAIATSEKTSTTDRIGELAKLKEEGGLSDEAFETTAAKIRELTKLRAAGALSLEEFESQKADLLRELST